MPYGGKPEYANLDLRIAKRIHALTFLSGVQDR
jgi:hypothetical protein